MLAASPVSAQVPACDPLDQVFLAEGPISAVSAAPGILGTNPVIPFAGTIDSLGVVIHVHANAPVSTSTATLDMLRFADPAAFPGRTQTGFLGATVNGQRNLTVTFTQNGTLLTECTRNLLVSDPVGGGTANVTVQPCAPRQSLGTGTIVTRAEIFVDNADVDVATATTTVQQ